MDGTLFGVLDSSNPIKSIRELTLQASSEKLDESMLLNLSACEGALLKQMGHMQIRLRMICSFSFVLEPKWVTDGTLANIHTVS